jgi:hypothetical protein
MSGMTGAIRAMAAVGFLVMLAGALGAGMCAAQRPATGSAAQTGIQSSSRQNGGIPPASSGTDSPLDGVSSPFPDTSKQKRNDERQRRIVIDTQKLLALTAQLKAEVAASGAETMTPEMLKQMDEIEKLAKSVKEKMRN